MGFTRKELIFFMTKEELLQELSSKISTGEINRNEIADRFGLTSVVTNISTATTKTKTASSFSLTKLLYVLGAIIAVVGMVLFAYRVWDDIGSIGRISITLGLGLLITIIGIFLSKDKSTDKDNIGTIFYFIGGLLIPGGAMVALHEFFSLGTDLSWPLAVTFCVIFVFYLLMNYVQKNAILTFFTIANGTAFVYLIVGAITNGMLDNTTDLYAYLTMIIGTCYILLAYSFRDSWNVKLVPVLNFFGFIYIQGAILSQYFNGWNHSMWPVLFSLGLVFVFYLFLNSHLKNAALTGLTIINGTAFVYIFIQELIKGSYYSNGDIYVYLTMVIGMVYMLLAYSFRGGFNDKLVDILNFFGIIGLLGSAFSKIYGSFPWQMFFLILVIGGFAYSVYARSRIILIISTLFLLSYISYITGEYFADSVGWPISLVVLGFIFIGLGYVSININKKYIAG